ncbi:MAG TPA: multidrug ABC transporter permease [Porphyromonadaceae bacterium]|nr:multidrug ABC transporter permease [Porphyromonadaceae bacterium]
MSQFNTFVQKEFYHIFRDKRTLLIILGMPIVQMLLFGFAMNMEVTHIRTAVFDPSPDQSTTQITRRIEANPYFDVVGQVHSEEEVNNLMRQGAIDLAVIYESGFHRNIVHSGEAQIQFIADASDPNRGTVATNYVTGILAGYQQEMMQLQTIPFHINTETRMLYNPQMESAYLFVPGIMGLILMIICTMMTSVSIVREQEQGTMEVLLASPLKPVTVLMAKTIPYTVLSAINVASILLLSFFVLNVPIRGNFLLLLFVCLLYILLSLTLGLLISTLVKKQLDAVLVSGIGLMMPTLVLSGMIFPIGNMPLVLQWSSYFVPARWFITAVRKIMIEGQGIMTVLPEIGILLGMTVFLAVLSILNTKKRLA